jgi:hypothetical protein
MQGDKTDQVVVCRVESSVRNSVWVDEGCSGPEEVRTSIAVIEGELGANASKTTNTRALDPC